VSSRAEMATGSRSSSLKAGMMTESSTRLSGELEPATMPIPTSG